MVASGINKENIALLIHSHHCALVWFICKQPGIPCYFHLPHIMYALFINNKHGSLVYHRNFSQELKLSSNDEIRLASTFHGLSAIAARLTPITNYHSSQLSFIEPQGISSIEAENFRFCCFETLTGLKFCLVANVSTVNLEGYLKKVYELYSDYVLKNPFYDLDMPIRCELFDKEIEKFFSDTTHTKA